MYKDGDYMKCEFTEQQVNNLLIFMDKVEVKGLKECYALLELVEIIKKALREEN